MKKQLCILFCVVALVFGIFSYSTNSLAVENDKSSSKEVEFKSDSFPYDEKDIELINSFDENKTYKDGEILSESTTLHADTKHEIIYENGEIVFSSDSLYDTPKNRKKYPKYPEEYYLYEVQTINKFYSSMSAIKEDYEHYEKIDDNYLFKANLKFERALAFGDGFIVTFSGRVAVFPKNDIVWFNDKQ